jgi:hypothetical protein
MTAGKRSEHKTACGIGGSRNALNDMSAVFQLEVDPLGSHAAVLYVGSWCLSGQSAHYYPLLRFISTKAHSTPFVEFDATLIARVRLCRRGQELVGVRKFLESAPDRKCGVPCLCKRHNSSEFPRALVYYIQRGSPQLWCVCVLREQRDMYSNIVIDSCHTMVFPSVATPQLETPLIMSHFYTI